jgi:hypothetical protein
MSTRLSDDALAREALRAAESVFAADLARLERGWKCGVRRDIEFLSFAGGGISALIALCVISGIFDGDKEAYRAWRARRLRGVSGTSFGSLLACMVCAGMDWDEAMSCVLDVVGDGMRVDEHLSSYLMESRSSIVDERMIMTIAGVVCERAFTNRFVTFEEAFAATGIELVVVCCDICTGKNVELCRTNTPSMRVADAMRASCAIPVLMPPLIAGRATLVDGGMINNFALAFKQRDRTLFLSTRFEGLAEPPGVVTADGAFQATKIMIDCQHHVMLQTGAVPPHHIVMCPRLFGFLSFPFENKARIMDAFRSECSTAVAKAFYRQWIEAITIACILSYAAQQREQADDPRELARRFAAEHARQ